MNPMLYEVFQAKPRMYFRGERWHCEGTVRWLMFGLIPRRKKFAYSSEVVGLAFLGWQMAALGMLQGG